MDAVRGLCILGMICVHLVYDLTGLYDLVKWELPDWFSVVQRWGGVLFLLISGICVTLGSRSVRRGAIVFACGMLCTAVTAGMYWLKLAEKGIIIYFGVLHCLGACMMLWPAVKKAPTWLVGLLGIVLTGLGLYFQTLPPVSHPALIPLGLMPEDFVTSDYFPLLPNFGFFLLGAVLGRTVSDRKESLLPRVHAGSPALRFLCACGKHSLWIYLLHQPVISGILLGISVLTGAGS